MVETIVVIMMTLLLVFGAIQFAMLYNAKSTLNYAVFEATRAGALNYGDRQAVEFALAAGLSPLYTSLSSQDQQLSSINTALRMYNNVEQVKNARNDMLTEIRDEEFVCIRRISPSNADFDAYAVADPTGIFPDQKLIPNDHLKYRTATIKGSSKLTLQDANLLKIEVTYCHYMDVPVIATVVRRLFGVKSDPDPVPGWVTPTTERFRKNCFDKSRVPIVSQAIIRMQTPIKNDSYATSCL